MDTILRALTEDECFRAVVFVGPSTARGAVAAQSVSGDVARRLSELVIGTVLVRETMAPGHRVQGILAYRGSKVSFVGDSHPEGKARGLVQGGDKATLPAEQPLLQLMRTLRNGELHQGIIALPEEGMKAGLMEYMQQSEQVTTLVDVCPEGGYLVQLLPDAKREGIERMLEHAKTLPPVEEMLRDAATPLAFLERVLGPVPFSVTVELEHDFGCHCSEQKMLDGLATLARAEIQSMRNENKTFEVQCDFCNAQYEIRPDALQRMLDVS